jgi:hypothetical protein
MTDEEAMLLLRRPVDGNDDVGTVTTLEIKLLESLERLPLAIVQATAFMKQTSTSIQEYLTMFDSDKTKKKLLDWNMRDRYRYGNVSRQQAIAI